MTRYKCILWCPELDESPRKGETWFEMSTTNSGSVEYSASHQMYKIVSRGLGGWFLITTVKMEDLSFQKQIS